MPAIAFDIIVLLGIVYCGFLGLSRGFFTAAVAGVEVLGAFILAILLHEPLAGLIGPLFMDSFGFFMPGNFAVQPWAVFLCFSLVFWTTLWLIWKFANPTFIDTEVLPPPLIDQLGGALAGAFAGSLFLGAILVNWSMCPLLAAVPVPAGDMSIDVGRMTLRTAARFAGERLATGWCVPADGEPQPADGIDGTIRLSSEAWRDRNASGQWEKSEDLFCDSDANGTWTKDYKYVDLDGDRRRRVGLVEKYVVGCWDGGIRVDEREPGAGGGPPKAPPPKSGPQPPPPTPTPPPATGQKPPETPPVKPPVKSGTAEPRDEPVEEFF